MIVLKKTLGILAIILLLCSTLAGCVMGPLSLEISSPEDGAELNVNLPRVSGTVSDSKATVMVNGVEAKVAKDGTFYAYIELAKGKNTIKTAATLGEKTAFETITVIFSPALAVYLDYPQPEWGVDYTKTSLNISGTVSDPEATITVNGNEATVAEDGSFSTQIQLAEGNNAIEAVAILGEKRDSMVNYIIITPEGQWVAPPGGAGGPRYHSRVFHDESVELKAGEAKSLDVTIEIQKDICGPGEFSCTVFRVDKEYSEDKMSMPEGLEVSIEPSKFTAYPNTTYHSTIAIKTTSKLAPGEYFLYFQRYFENKFWSVGWIKVNVEP